MIFFFCVGVSVVVVVVLLLPPAAARLQTPVGLRDIEDLGGMVGLQGEVGVEALGLPVPC